jgi:hypothetical protein
MAISSFMPSAVAHQHQDALAVFLQAEVRVNPIGPDIDVLLALQRTLRPLVVLLLPDLLEPRDGGGGQGRVAGPKDRRERIDEVARRGPLRYKNGISSSRLFDFRRYGGSS